MVNEVCCYLYHVLLQLHIHIVERQCENCYAFINIAKNEYSLFEEEVICSINFMTWDEHFFYFM